MAGDNLTGTDDARRELPRSDLLASQTRLVSRVGSRREPAIDLREKSNDATRPEPRAATATRDEPAPVVGGRVAVVTGGDTPIGRAVALALTDSGARVCVLGSRAESLRDTTSAAGPGAAILYLQCDLGSASDIAGAADFIARWDRPVDLLVHAAECRVAGGVIDGTAADLDEQYLVNLRGPYLLTQQLAPQLRRSPGHVVFLDATPDRGASDVQFAMSKAGLAALAAGVRDELGDDGVRVTVVTRSSPEVGATDVADLVLGAIELPHHVELRHVEVAGTRRAGEP